MCGAIVLVLLMVVVMVMMAVDGRGEWVLTVRGMHTYWLLLLRRDPLLLSARLNRAKVVTASGTCIVVDKVAFTEGLLEVLTSL